MCPGNGRVGQRLHTRVESGELPRVLLVGPQAAHTQASRLAEPRAAAALCRTGSQTLPRTRGGDTWDRLTPPQHPRAGSGGHAAASVLVYYQKSHVATVTPFLALPLRLRKI
eukprot:6749810-Prymnesium_polylepis.1